MAPIQQGFYINRHSSMLSHFHADDWPCCKNVTPPPPGHAPRRIMSIEERSGYQRRLKNRARRLNRRVSFVESSMQRKRQSARVKKMKHGHEALAPENDDRKKECMLLERLPIELRLRIWELIVGGQVLHVVCEAGRIGTYMCDKICRSSVECRKWSKYDLTKPFPAKSKDQLGMKQIKRAVLLSLPSTCRAM
jgi:hypothetical protein